MNTIIEKSILFAGGLILGGITGYVSAKMILEKKYADIADMQINDMKEYYERRVAYDTKSDDILVDEAVINAPKEADEIREKLLDNYEKTTNYAAVYSEIHNEEVDIKEDTPEDIANKEHQENKNKPPRVISLEEYENLPPYITCETLYFYHYDEIITDDNEEEVVAPEMLLGDALESVNFQDSDEQIIFVMNYATDTAYEIQRVMGGFTDG